MVIDLIVQLKKDMQRAKNSKNPFLRLRVRRLRKNLLFAINKIHTIDITCDLLRELPIFIGDFPESNFSFIEVGTTVTISYTMPYPHENSKFSIEIRQTNSIQVKFVDRTVFGVAHRGSKFYKNSITADNANIKDKYTRDIILRIKNAIVSELYRYIDEI